jgi:hypothetical protein
MGATIEIEGDNARHLIDLQQWLQGDRSIGGAARLRHKPIGEGELGGAVDVLEIALGSGGIAIVLTNALITWLKTRREHISVTLKVKGASVSVDTENAKLGTAKAMLDSVLRHVDEP